MIDAAYWRDRRVLITGHTGFKGSWLAFWLSECGASVAGIALAPVSAPNLFSLLGLAQTIDSRLIDLRDRGAIAAAVRSVEPEIVIHMAAQPIVRHGIARPAETFSTNVLGLVHLLDAIRDAPKPASVVNVTSDKVYAEAVDDRAFREDDALGGSDPYSASKACAEIVTSAYVQTYGVSACTARAGNVIGGGDWSEDRLVPDLVRAMGRGVSPQLRNPTATRPWQHVLDALSGYVLLAQRLIEDPSSARGAWNFGPVDAGSIPVSALARAFSRAAGATTSWQPSTENAPAERMALRLDSTKARERLHWRSRLNVEETVALTAEWYIAVARGDNARDVTRAQIERYERS